MRAGHGDEPARPREAGGRAGRVPRSVWVAPRDVVEKVGLLDERFVGAFYEDDDYRERLRLAGVPTRQIASVKVWSRRVGLTMSKLPDKGQGWLHANRRRFVEKWGWVPPPTDPDLRVDQL